MSRYHKSQALFERANQVIPNGIYGHTAPAASLPMASPYFAERGEGCRYWDVDGHEYIDYMCSFGPNLLGINHPEIEAAASEQRAKGNCFTHPTERMVELAEALVERVDFADWAVFAKNGGDVTTWAVQVAREATGRKKILRLRGGYHGVDPWCTPGHGGLIEEDRVQVHEFFWNEPSRFVDLLGEFRGEVAGVILTPFHHPVFADMVLPESEFLRVVEDNCRKEGIVLILDDIRAGFRLHRGGSHQHFGFTPDIICFCKALGNGYPISAALGTQALRVPSSRVFLTGSYWGSAVPMAAALKVLEIIDRDSIIKRLEGLGTRLRDGLVRMGEESGWKIVPSGPPAVPFYRFAQEKNFRYWQRFCALVIERGAYFHPHHNWFISAAHTEAAIDRTLQIAREAMAVFIDEKRPSLV